MPLEKLPKGEMHKRFDGHSRFRLLDSAARRESVDWEVPIREEEFISILLPELQQLRDFGRSLAAKARLQIADREFDDAVHTLQTGYALARHASEGSTLIHALVGIADQQRDEQAGRDARAAARCAESLLGADPPAPAAGGHAPRLGGGMVDALSLLPRTPRLGQEGPFARGVAAAACRSSSVASGDGTSGSPPACPARNGCSRPVLPFGYIPRLSSR